jgi:ligand-binding sensor domain-containing protein/anti-sigma regulatory factor (Ser/Thr protein kinase)
MSTWLILVTLVISLANLSGCNGQATGSSPDPATAAAATPTSSSSSILPASIPAEPNANIRFTHIGEEAGLSQSSIHCILQDRQGFLWFGTEDGLNRYDGYNFKVYRPVLEDGTSLSDRWITAILQDSKGSIWVGTRQGGMDRYDPATEKFSRYMHSPENPDSISSNFVTTIFEDSRGHLWVGTEEGLDQFSPGLDNFKHFSLNVSAHMEDISYDITTIFEDSNGSLWVGSSQAGLSRYDQTLERFFNYLSKPDNPATLTSNDIRSIRQGTGNFLWVATDNGLNLFDPASGIVTHYQHSSGEPDSLASDLIRTLYVDRSGNLWVGTNAGLDHFQPSSGHFIHYQHNSQIESSLSNNVVTAIFESSDNVMWVGTFGGGVNKYYRGQDQFAYYYHKPGDPSSLNGNVIFKIHVDADKKAWLSIYGSGVDCLDMKTGAAIHYQNDPADPGSLTNNEVWTVYTDRAGTLWVGTASGLDRRSPGSDGFIHFQHEQGDNRSLIGAPVYDILEDSQGNLWIGTEVGLDYYNRETNTFTHYQHDPQNPSSLGGNEIVNLFMDKNGVLWAGSFNDGLNRFDAKSRKFIRYQYDSLEPGSISNDSILSIYQDSRGILWTGTDGGGLNRYDPGTNSFSHYYESDGLPSNVIYGIVEDDQGLLWLSTNNGITRFNPLDNTFRNYTVRNGLQGNEFNMNAYARDLDGNIYFAGVNGLTVFDPASITDSTFVPPIALVSVSQNGTPIKVEEKDSANPEIVLRWPNNNFEFEFAALSYAEPERNLYAYRLENFDPDWNQIGTWRDGRYTNLPGGTYTLRLKGSNQDGVWNETGLAFQVSVIPPFWQTPWFLVTAAGGILGLFFTGYWLRIKSVQANNRELERQVRDRTREIEHLFEKTKELAIIEERNRLARELHDSAKQKAFAALAQLGTANGIIASNPRAAKEHLDEAENLVYEVIEELTFLIQEMYPLFLKEKGLATSLRDYVFEWEGRTGIRVEVNISGQKRLKLEIEQAIYRIIQEALSNVARHSRATRVDLTLTYQSHSIEAVVADNGCGFEQQNRPAGIGLRSIQERAESLGGTLEIASAPDCGTRLTARIPIGSGRKSGKGESNV